MWHNKRWGVTLAAMILLFTFLVGCGKDEGKSPDQKGDAAKGEQNQQEGTGSDENPVPVVDVDLGLKPDDVIAKYEGGTLTAKQFEDYLQIQAFVNPQAGFAIQQKDPEGLKKFVESYVVEKTMAEKAPQINDIDQEAKKLAEQIKSQYLIVYNGDEKKLEKQMKDQGVTDEELQDFFVQYKKVESYLGSQVSEEEMKKYYEEGKKEHNFVIASVRHILIFAGEQPNAPADYKPRTDEEAKKLAQELTDRLRKGEDFAKLAKEYSEDPGSKEKGGLYEDESVSRWVPEFKKAAVELPLDTISDPVKTDYGYHVIKVEKRTEKTFDELKDNIRLQFINEKYDDFSSKNLKSLIKDEDIHLPKKPKE